MQNLPWTPDFDIWPITQRLTNAEAEGEAVVVHWDDGKRSAFHTFFLRENSPDRATIHPLSRETLISPLDLPADLAPQSAEIDETGALSVVWSHGGHVSRFHPGWLRAHAWFGDETEVYSQVLWTASELEVPPTFQGPKALDDPATNLAWLEAIRDYGIARLDGLPQEDGLLEREVSKIGPIRESNFGRSYSLEIKDEPDSNAFTSAALLQHMDMPTRECPHGLQFLYCRENSVSGGEGIYADGYRIAEDLKAEEPVLYQSLATDIWQYNNRSKVSDYRASGPIIETDAKGRTTGLRYNTWLRGPLKAPLEVQDRAYRAVRAFASRAQDPAYQIKLVYRPGDLLAFDNRRIVHGRVGYDAKIGRRHIEGVYSDRDDLHSAIRTLKRQLASTEPPKTA